MLSGISALIVSSIAVGFILAIGLWALYLLSERVKELRRRGNEERRSSGERRRETRREEDLKVCAVCAAREQCARSNTKKQ